MSLQTQLHSFVLRAAQEFNTLSAKIGSLATLSTTDKTNLVAAINELKTAVNASTSINDSQVTTTTTYSSSKIVTLLDALKNEILGGADAAYDTLLELQQAIQADQSGITALLDAVNKRVRYDAAQTLTAAEQAQARSNIGAVAASDVGDTAFDFVAAFEAALV
jgi:capsid protein